MPGEWQDIATAPKDAPELLIYVQRTKEMFVAYWDFGQSRWAFAHDPAGVPICLRNPTHWMPLPPPPETRDE